ncbi:MAG: alpha/beta hydrolase [Acidimicrobiia bacterium]|nr:alpha/beta hydrolase [Acidimicrobiia bacterium]
MELTVRDSRVSATTGGRDLDQGLPLLVFIHGAALDKTTWQLQTRYFAHHGFSVLAVDLPGHGASDGPVLGAIEDYADWVAELVAAAGFGEAHLVGHSMGALIALEAAARHPRRATTLTMCGGAAAIRVHPGLLAASEKGEQLAYELMSSWGHGKPFHLGGHQTPGLWMMGGTIRLWERAPTGVLASDLHACNAYRRGPEAAGRIRCRALLVSGSLDIMTPSRAAAPLRERLAGLQEVTIEGAGHIMMVEQPDPVIDAIAGFLEDPAPR